MRALIVACALLSAACATPASAPPRAARLAYGDLDPATRDGQDRLVERVRTAARAYCDHHAEDVVPWLRRREPDYCHRVMRAGLVDHLPPRMRWAYDRGWARSDRRLR